MNVNWQGVYPEVTTQYNDDLTINFETTKAMVDRLIKKGVVGRFNEVREIWRWSLLLLRLDTMPKLVQRIKLCKQFARRDSELTCAPRTLISDEERTNVERNYNEAVANRIDLSKFNLD